MVVCVRPELVHTVTAFYDAGSTRVDLVKKKRKGELVSVNDNDDLETDGEGAGEVLPHGRGR